jgi:hypothetical protein
MAFQGAVENPRSIPTALEGNRTSNSSQFNTAQERFPAPEQNAFFRARKRAHANALLIVIYKIFASISPAIAIMNV